MADARLAIPRVLGAVAPLGAAVPQARVSVARVLGAVQPLGDVPVPGARVSVARVLGAVKPLIEPVVEARAGIARVIGRVRPRALNRRSIWEAAGLPCPRLEGYAYGNRAGLVRTTYDSGVTRQRRRWSDGYATASATLTCTAAQLALVETVDHFTWFQLTLRTGEGLTEHLVRLREVVEVEALTPDYFTARLTLDLHP